MNNNLDSYADLEIYMEYLCSNDNAIKAWVLEEIGFRKWSWFNKKLTNLICRVAIIPLSFSELQYESFMYSEKEIRKAFFKMLPFFLMTLCLVLSLIFLLGRQLL